MYNIDHIWPLINEAFPDSEHRDYEGQKKLFDRSEYRVIAREENGEVIGFAAFWEIENCTFIEHLAVDKSQRGKGIGADIMDELKTSATLPLILEVELAQAGDMAQRRIEFYRRLGFYENPFPYMQPAMQEGQSPIPLMIMSYPSPLSHEEFEKIGKSLVKEIYSKL